MSLEPSICFLFNIPGLKMPLNIGLLYISDREHLPSLTDFEYSSFL